MKSKMEHEDRSVLALLYEAYRRSYPVSVENLQKEIAAVFVGVCDDHSLYAYETGVRTSVRLALDSVMGGGGECF